MDSKENATSCPVCQEIYTDPRSLACGHSFCLQCLKGVAGNKQTFPCPICRFDVDLRYTNVDQLPKNYVLCIVIEALDKNTTSMCLDHNKSLDLFCQRCGVVICSKCLTMQHKGHDFEDIELIYTEQNKQLVAFLESTNHLTSMTKAKSDVVKQSRISMEKNIDSISKTVENTFKKWNDALQKQHLTIASYVYQERDQKRKVCVDAEETDINKLRSKDTAFVVQHYGSLKTRKEDIERKVLQDIETCFSPPDNLVIEVYAPWIEEAINNIQLLDMKQAQARQIPQTIAEIQEENFILKRELDNIYVKISEFANTIAGVEGSDVTLFPEKAKQFTALGVTTSINSAKQNKQSERSLKLDKDLERVTSAWTDMKEKYI
ncbi:hypothetical protein ACJMK2_031534 [Sinanodonta woodiana]|uniref:Uncharacterized protein n=1 Tax=Sinanodonta woodiana TaxID=1069815 RepID=A0ABD3X168_SINWO